MIRVCAPEVSRSTADWASSASLIIVNHSAGSLFEVRGDNRGCLAVPLNDELVEVCRLFLVRGDRCAVFVPFARSRSPFQSVSRAPVRVSKMWTWDGSVVTWIRSPFFRSLRASIRTATLLGVPSMSHVP